MRTVLAYSLHIASPVSFSRAGKLDALQEDWQHSASRLEDFELIIVTKGILYLQYGQERYTVREGEYLLLAPIKDKQTEYTRQDRLRRGFQKSRCSFYWMHFNCLDAAPRYALTTDRVSDGRDNILLPVHGQLPVPQKALLLMVQLQDCVLSGYDRHYTDYLSTLILCEIANQHALQYQQALFPEENGGSRQLYHDIVGYIQQELHRPLKVSDIAAKYDYNEKYLSRLFRKFAGMQLKQYILQQKMKSADFLLVDSSVPVSEIASSLGFSSYHVFERAYVKSHHMTPTAYRQLYAKKINNYV